ncbi:MAG TPA: YraN family protein [Candidatus Acidoferrales bacterium]|nr:YraN family protein [Candidatus Acidoferrales bacterium]
MPFVSRTIFGLVQFAARHGLAEAQADESAKEQARRTGVRGETYAYWYLRRHGYIMVGRNYRAPDAKGEIDMIGYDGPVLAFVEVKTRSGTEENPGRPEEAVTPEKRTHVERMARRFKLERRATGTSWRFDVVAIENRPHRSPIIRLHKGAFAAGN